MALPRVFRNVALQVARAVARNDLFEKPGERPRTPSLGASTGGAPVDVLAGAVIRGAPSANGAALPVAPAALSDAPVRGTGAGRRKGGKGKEGAPAAPGADASRGPSSATAAPAASVPVARPSSGCIPVDLTGLKQVLTPNGKPIVVNHWATWCDPCVDELPRLVRSAAGVADIGEFLGLSWDLFDHPGDPAVVARKVAGFADSVGVGYGSVLFTGKPDELFSALNLSSQLIPQTHVIAPDGTVVWSKNGVIDHDDVFPLIKAVKAAAGN
jgi:thiol-disulfide isomerase/thioredoxin